MPLFTPTPNDRDHQSDSSGSPARPAASRSSPSAAGHLALGSALSADEMGYRAVRGRVLELTGVDLDCYKHQQMLRRLGAILSRCQLRDLAHLASELKPGSVILREFMERFTINVTECFRDGPRFEQLQRAILPEIIVRNPSPRIWSAGCSYGAEPYSLAIILAELRVQHSTILATDIDPKILEVAQAGASFLENDLKNMSGDLVARYFIPGDNGTYRVAERVRGSIIFKRHNLLEPAPGKGFDLVLCRNVTIYLTEEAKDRVTAHLAGALRPGGVLFIGETETLHHPQYYGLLRRMASFYERIG